MQVWQKISLSRIHLIAFNVPYPADYGGVIDIYHKIRAFHKIGVKVILHCFEYGRHSSLMLNEICQKVYYYPRSKSPLYLIDSMPFIVATRVSKELSETLQRDKAPVLFEGLHTTASLREIASEKRKCVVRTHNVEHDYYRGLMEAEGNLPRKLFFYSESVKLKHYERILRHATAVAAISRADHQYFSEIYDHVHYIPAFHPNDGVDVLTGHGEYALFHGNLSVPENQKAALYLIENVFRTIDFPFVIAGKDPGGEIVRAAAVNDHIKVVPNPGEEEMAKLIRHAHINILYTFQATGIKLKLLAALHMGRHCIVNPPMVETTGLADLCFIARNDQEAVNLIKELREKDVTDEAIGKRKSILESELSNVKNAEKLAALLF